MTPERWARIKEVFGAALEMPEGARAGFLEQACGADEPLRREIERLLAERIGSAFMKSPASGILADSSLESGVKRELAAGEMLRHYRIDSKLGAGGMGVVYRARDTHLDRFVAIKILPPGKVADPDRKRRFIQEAKAASALNHPNIITVHDIDAEGEFPAMVMECVEGKTLEQLIPPKGLRLKVALDLAVQMADALARAHSAGIIHRDLKPSNVMVDGHGLVKVLDFGLAKLTEAVTADTDAPTRETAATTGANIIAGTPAFMSPEQAQGQKVDARSDIFSFGALLYQMVTGRRAFQGETPILTMAAVIDREPAPLPAGIPRDLEKVITRCLRKDSGRRYQHMADLKVELEELRTDSESQTLAAEAPRPAPRGRRRLLAAAIAVPLLAIAGWFLLRQISAPLPPPSVVHLTSYPGSELCPSFSPDGNQVAFQWNGEKQDNYDIYVKLVGGGAPLRLTTDPAPDIFPAWSPDGHHIAFVRQASIYLVSPLGEQERKVADFRRTQFPSICWSPNGKWLAVAEAEPQGANGIFLIPVERGERRRLTSNAGFFDHSPSFSPDGRFLAYASCRGYSVVGAESCDVNLIELDPDFLPKGQAHRLTNQNANIAGTAWTRDGRSVIYASGPGRDFPHLWRVAISGTAKPERLELAGARAKNPAVSPVGNRLAYDQAEGDPDIWKFEAGALVKNFIASTLIEANPQFSPDGKRIVFNSSRSGDAEIWVCNQDGSKPVQLTDRVGRRGQGSPRWSPDSRWIAFDSQGDDGHQAIYLVDAAGGQPRRLTTQPSNEALASWSRDGKWIYFRSDRSGRHEIWRTPVGGGEASQVTDNGGTVAFESWDGKTLYYTKELPAAAAVAARLFARSLAGGPERQVLGEVTARAFTVVEDGIYYIAPAGRIGAYSLLFFDLATGKSRALTGIEGQIAFGLTVSPDRKTFLFSVGRPVNFDLMLIENFR